MMERNENVVPLRRTFQCASCGSENGTSSIEPIEFDYDRGKSSVRLKARVTIDRCHDCGEYLLGEGAEEVKHDTVCRYLGVLTPSEITALRKSLGLSRDQLSDITGIGSASIARWEIGKLIQNTAYDRLLRLMTVPGVLRKLEQMGNQVDNPEAKPTFRCLVRDAGVEARAAKFEFN